MKTLHIILAAFVVTTFCASAKAQEATLPYTIECSFDLSDPIKIPGIKFFIRFEVELTDKYNGQEVDTFSQEVWTPVHVQTTLHEYVIWDEKGVEGRRGPFKLTINRDSRKATVFLPNTDPKGPVTHDNGDCQPKSKL